jgi:hypothetical protein
VISLFGKKPSKRDEARATAKAEYEEALNADVASRAGRALVIRAGARAKAHIDKTFISGAERAEAYDTARALAIAQDEEMPEPPKADPYQSIKSVKGDLLVFLPSPFADRVFRLGMQYQLTEISAEEAVEAVQHVADMVSRELQLDQPFVALEFLREQLAEDAGTVDENSEAGDASSDASDQESSQADAGQSSIPDLPPPRGR